MVFYCYFKQGRFYLLHSKREALYRSTARSAGSGTGDHLIKLWNLEGYIPLPLAQKNQLLKNQKVRNSLLWANCFY